MFCAVSHIGKNLSLDLLLVSIQPRTEESVWDLWVSTPRHLGSRICWAKIKLDCLKDTCDPAKTKFLGSLLYDCTPNF